MKNFIKTISFLTIAAIMITSCSKENKIRKNLSGTWKVLSATDSTFSALMALGATAQFQFSDCKKKDEPCNGAISYTFNFGGFPISASVPFTWTVKKEVLYMTPSDTLTPAGTYNIEFTDKDKITATDVNNASSIINLEIL